MRAKGKQTPFHQKVKIFIYIYLPSKEGHCISFHLLPWQPAAEVNQKKEDKHYDQRNSSSGPII